MIAVYKNVADKTAVVRGTRLGNYLVRKFLALAFLNYLLQNRFVIADFVYLSVFLFQKRENEFFRVFKTAVKIYCPEQCFRGVRNGGFSCSARRFLSSAEEEKISEPERFGIFEKRLFADKRGTDF